MFFMFFKLYNIQKGYLQQGRHHVNLFGRGLCKSWTFSPAQYLDLSEGSTKTE